MIAASVPVAKAAKDIRMIKMFLSNLNHPIMSQKVMISKVGGKRRHRNVHVRAPVSDISKSKFSVIKATNTVHGTGYPTEIKKKREICISKSCIS